MTDAVYKFVNHSFYHNNWRCLPTQLLSYHTTIRLKRAFVVVLFGVRRLKVWAYMLAKSTTKLSDLLVGFNVNICVNGKASLKKVMDPKPQPIIFLFTGGWSVSCRRLPALEDSTFGEHFLHFTDDGANTPKLVWSWIVT